MRVVVTGAAGFIGANLCRQLLQDGHAVIALDNLSTGYRANLDGVDVDFREADIRDETAMASAAGGADTVVHLAARGAVPRSIEDPGLTNSVNVDGTLTVLLAARNHGCHLIFSSSSSVYGANEQLPKTEGMRAQPMSPYAASKLAGENYVLAFQHVYAMSALAFRFFNVYGPLQSAGHAYAAVVPCFLDALLGGQPLTVYGDGKQSRDFTSVETVVRVLARAVDQKVTHEDVVNLAFGTSTSLLELIAQLEELADRRAHLSFVPPRPGDVRASQADGTRLHALFPDVKPQDLEHGLRATLRWFETRTGLQS